jgi:hypothetical protein
MPNKKNIYYMEKYCHGDGFDLHGGSVQAGYFLRDETFSRCLRRDGRRLCRIVRAQIILYGKIILDG